VSYPLFTESLRQMLSDRAENMRWCLIMHEPHVLPSRKSAYSGPMLITTPPH
jgi:hypothetical protein